MSATVCLGVFPLRFGNMVPQSLFGRIFGAMCMLFGILLIALPEAIIGAKFQ